MVFMKEAETDQRLPANVASDDKITAKNGTGRHLLVDGMWNNASRHGELDWSRVDDAHNVSGSWCFEDAEERPVSAVFGVELHDLLVVVGALEELDARI
jgi:hypothetical protein